MSRWITLLSVLMILCVPLAASAQVETESDDASWCISVWYPSSSDQTGIEELTANADLIDVVNPFWYAPREDGTVYAADADAENAEKLAAWREAGLVILPSILTTMSAMIDTPESRANHAQNIVDLVERMDYDGIDIDYEGFILSTRDNYSAFIELLSQELHAQGRLLSVTVHPKTRDDAAYEGAAAQDWSRLAPPADVFNIMTYDYTSRNEPPGPVAPTPWVHDVLAYAETVTDLTKVRMGLPFYGYSWLRNNPPSTAVSWVSTQRLIESFEIEIERDEDSMTPHILVDVPRLPDQTIYFSDATELEFKLAMVAENFPTLGGVAIWGIGGEDPANWDILREMQDRSCEFGGD
jgi:spore germination protein